MQAKDLHEYLERLSNLMRNEARRVGADYDLLPIQQEALHYLSLSNRYSDTPMGMTEYLGQTKGTVSQTIKVLEKKGLLKKVADKNDKRIIHLHLSRAGLKLVNNLIPTPLIESAICGLNKTSQQKIHASLDTLLGALHHANDMKNFGICHSCRHNQKIEQGFFCGLTQEPLSKTDVQLICREFETAAK